MDRAQLIDDLVAANHILYDQGVVDAYGHVSARDPDDPERFLIARYKAPGLVDASDICTLDLSGRVVIGPNDQQYTERFIHAAVYAARPDVHGVVHSHSPAIVPFTVSDVPLRPISGLAGFLQQVARFDTRPVAGDTDLLIRSLDLGAALAQTLGSANVALLRGHGSVAAGRSLREAVFRAVYTEVNARQQAEAIRLGGSVTYLTDGEAALNEASKDPGYRRAWDFWTRLVANGRARSA